jgi:signal transduction histidine kinase
MEASIRKDSDDLHRSAAEQAALRRVATLVARGAARTEIFEALVTEVGLLIPATDAALVRLHSDETVTMIGRWNETDGYQDIGVVHPFGSGTLARLIWEHQRPSRITSYAGAPGSLAEMIRSWGWRSSVGAPVTVDGHVWGLTAVGSTNDQTLPPGTEEQLAAFTDLLATAIANEQSREELEQLAAEQAALRRVAELAAHDALPGDVLETVVAEAAGLVGVAFTTLLRFEPDGATEVVAIHDPPEGVTVGMRAPGDGDGATQRVWRTRRTARADRLSSMTGAWPQVAASRGFSSSAAAPILAEDRLWGALVAAGRGPLPVRIEEQLSRFAELAGTAIASSQARAVVQALADEQAALLRVAERVARAEPPDEVFAAVAAEAQQLLGGQPMTLTRFEDDAALVVVSRSGGPAPPGTRIAYVSDTLPDRVRRAARAVRVDDYSNETDAALAREFGLAAAVAAPIEVESRVWGMLTATSADGPLEREVEHRLQRFANLAGTAVSNAASHAQLIASRARVLSTADETRRRLQRDVHDGTQQRLVQTVITLKLARQAIAEGDVPASVDRIEEALKHAQLATDQLRELVSGILPSALTRRGLRGGVQSLLADLPLPVEAVIDVPRLPAQVETTAYFVVAEALTNVVKHAHASQARVLARVSADAVHIEVDDDGVGGAQAGTGSGLTGLFDRVEACGGTLRIDSPMGQGTTVEAMVPIGKSARVRTGNSSGLRQARPGVPHVGQHGAHPAVLGALGADAELAEDGGHVLFHGRFTDGQGRGDTDVRLAFGHHREHGPLTGGQVTKRVVVAVAPQHPPDDRGIQRGTPGRDPLDRADERIDVPDALLEQVAHAFGVVTDEVQGVGLLVELRKNQDAEGWLAAAQLHRRDQAVVVTVRRHLDVHDDDVRAVGQCLGQQVVGVPGLGHHLETGLGQQAHDPLAHEYVVLADDHAQRAFRVNHRASGGTAVRSSRPWG